MSSVPLHPALVHVPLGLAFAAPFLAAGMAYALWRGLVPRRAWAAVVALELLLVAGGGAALLAGHRDGERAERLVGERAVEAHEERAEAFLWTAGAVAAVSAAVLVVPAGVAAPIAAIAAAGTLAVAGLGFATGKAGGELVYGATASALGAGAGGPAPRLERRPHR